ncbi:MAG TPA: enoyl-CoA hydratase/isomerase family protein [Solirubrobacterales bacterium]|nr:enoyl-CoA hydratase/isomerase family protein [Solirubrobacterales bacterium]
MTEAPVRLERDGAVAQMVLEAPPLNLFGSAVFEALQTCIDEVEGSDARALVWRAEGKVFTGGADVNVFQQIVDAGGDRSAVAFDPLLNAVRRIEALEIPTLALVHGLCLTAGLEVSLGCDMIWASESARFGLVEAVVGLTPGAGGTQRMAERAGPARAREFVMSQGVYDAATLERWNVVNRILPDGELVEKGMRFAHRLASGPTKAHAATKRIVRAYLQGGVDEADRVTPEVAGSLFHTEDLQRAVRSFLEEGPGKATFEGR